MKYFYIEDRATDRGAIEAKNLGDDRAKAIREAERLVGHLMRNELANADMVELWECDITDEEIEAIENGETEKWYGDYCTEIVVDFKKETEK